MSCNGEHALAMLPQTHELEVESGPNGFEEFLGRVRSLFGIDAEQQMDLTFDCAEPATGTGALHSCWQLQCIKCSRGSF